VPGDLGQAGRLAVRGEELDQVEHVGGLLDVHVGFTEVARRGSRCS
jgi:hypothetical protein